MSSVLVITSFLLVLSPLTSAVLTKVTCSTSGKGTCANPYCNLTPDGKVNFGCGNLTVPLNEIIVSHQVSVKIRDLNLPINIFPDIDYCAYVRNSGLGALSLNTFFSRFLAALEGQNPGFYHECPYEGEDFHIENSSFKSVEAFLGYLVTEYTFSKQVRNSNDENIFSITMMGDTRVKSLLDVGINLGINLLG